MAVEIKADPTLEIGATRTLFEVPTRIQGYDITAHGLPQGVFADGVLS